MANIPVKALVDKLLTSDATASGDIKTHKTALADLGAAVTGTASIVAADIANDAVTTAKILNLNVTSGKLAVGAAVANIVDDTLPVAKVTGTLPVAKGGTGAATLTTGSVLVGAGTSAPTFVAPSTAGNVLTSNGTTWTSATTTREMPVMTKASWSRYANSSTSILSMTSRRRIVATVSAKNLKLVFQNCYSEANGYSNITVKASVEDDLGTIYPVYFSGSRTATVLNTGELLTSDAIANLITGKGRTYFLRVNSSWASGNVYLNGIVDNTTQTGEGRIDSLDYTDSGTITPTTNYAYTANMVIGTPLAHNPYETIIFLGDSNMDLTAQGGYLTWEDNWTVSSLGRDAGRNFSYVRLSVGGSRVSTVLDAASTRRRRFFPYGSIFIVILGTNDARDHVNTPTTAAAIMANLVTLYRELLAAGAKEVWACTLPPDTSATNQNAIRVALNDLIRAEPNPLTGVLDLADELETARNSNVWKTNYASGDLYHLSATGGAAARDWLRALMFSQR